eukprot:scaffold54382_cov60-Phaeocystis_antarctica.AAC.4
MKRCGVRGVRGAGGGRQGRSRSRAVVRRRMCRPAQREEDCALLRHAGLLFMGGTIREHRRDRCGGRARSRVNRSFLPPVSGDFFISAER